jgi:hypothetical protein
MKLLAAGEGERSKTVRGLCGLADIHCTDFHQAVSKKLQVHQVNFNNIGDWYRSSPATVAAFRSSEENRWTVS